MPAPLLLLGYWVFLLERVPDLPELLWPELLWPDELLCDELLWANPV